MKWGNFHDERDSLSEDLELLAKVMRHHARSAAMHLSEHVTTSFEQSLNDVDFLKRS